MRRSLAFGVGPQLRRVRDALACPGLRSAEEHHPGARREIACGVFNEMRKTKQENPVDNAMKLAQMRDKDGLSNRAISKKIGKAEPWVSTRLNIARLDPEIRQLMREQRLSTNDKAVRALLTIEDSRQRVQIAKSLAEKQATARMVQHACRLFVKPQKSIKAKIDTTLAQDALIEIKGKQLPEYDALFQLGKVPPYPILNDVVMRTCDNCTLRPMASPTVCGQCALVCALSDLLKTISVEGAIYAYKAKGCQ